MSNKKTSNKAATPIIKPAFLRPKEAALFSGLGLSTVWRKASEGTFPSPIKLGAKTTVFRFEQLEAWAKDPNNWKGNSATQPQSAA